MKLLSMKTHYKIFYQIGRALAVVLFVLSAFGAKAGVTITTLHSFQVFTNGAHPNGLAFGGDGRDLYISACDTVYKVRLKVQGIIAGPDGRMVSVVR